MTSDPIPARTHRSTTPPADAVLPKRSPVAPAPGEVVPSHYTLCYSCGSDHPSGLHISVIADEGMAVHASFTVTDLHQGAPGLAHGGLLSAAIDDALGSLNWLLSTPAVTGRLETDFRRPVPVGETLYIHAEIVGVKGRKVFCRAVGRLGSKEGPVAISASALFIQVPVEHFSDYGRPEDVERAREDRAVRGSLTNFEVNP
ncbi:MAG: PaaI family thioesterase [Actinomycetes bacterium]